MTRRGTSAPSDARVRRVRRAEAGPCVGGAGVGRDVRPGHVEESGSRAARDVRPGRADDSGARAARDVRPGHADESGSRAARGVRRGWADESGSGTVLVLGVVAVAGVLLAVVALLVGAQGAQGRAQAGADLAALAAAQHLLDHGGAAEACEIAQAVARRNDVRLVSCSDTGSGVVVVRTVRASAAGPATARARAGPVSARS